MRVQAPGAASTASPLTRPRKDDGQAAAVPGLPLPQGEREISNHPVNGRIRISTRRFWARPSTVALEATGSLALRPATNRRSRITP